MLRKASEKVHKLREIGKLLVTISRSIELISEKNVMRH